MPNQYTRTTREEMRPILDEVKAKGWTIEATNGSGVRLRCTGPNGEGPVFVSPRAYGREIENQKRNLRQHGFVFDGDKIKETEEVAAQKTTPPPAETELPSTVDQMLDALKRTIGNEFAALTNNPEIEQWQQAYEEEAQKVKALEEELAAQKAKTDDLLAWKKSFQAFLQS